MVQRSVLLIPSTKWNEVPSGKPTDIGGWEMDHEKKTPPPKLNLTIKKQPCEDMFLLNMVIFSNVNVRFQGAYFPMISNWWFQPI